MHKLVIVEQLHEKYIEQLNQLAQDWQIICSKDSTVYIPHLADA